MIAFQFSTGGGMTNQINHISNLSKMEKHFSRYEGVRGMEIGSDYNLTIGNIILAKTEIFL